MIPAPITLDGKTGTVVYLDARWQPVASTEATMARVLFDDGSSAFFQTQSVVKKFDEAQHPRDKDGKFTFYHGTAESNLESILSQGLLTQRPNTVWPTISDRDQIYMGVDETVAQRWGEYAAHEAGTPQIAVIKIRIPEDRTSDLRGDVHFEEVGQDESDNDARQFKGPIPPEWIIGVKIGTPTGRMSDDYTWEERPLKKAASDGQIVYVVVLLHSVAAPGIGGITQKFDEALHPRDKDGRFAEATQPRIFSRPEDVALYSSWGEQRWAWIDKATGKPGGSLLTGTPIPRDQIPATLYHVTTNAPAVEASGVLLGLLESGGLGGGQAEGVSFTSSHEDAVVIQRELRRAVQIARGEITIEDIERFAREDEQEAGLPHGALKDAVTFAVESSYRANEFTLKNTFVWDEKLPEDQRGYVGPPHSPEEHERLRRSLMKDAFNAYLQVRGHADVPLLKNPILFGRQEYLAKLDPTNIQILHTAAEDIPADALVTTGSDTFLHEVRVYADVPRRRAQKYDPNQARDPQGTTTGGQFAEMGRGGPVSDPVLAAQAKAGIAEVEKLIPEAVRTANFEFEEVRDWDNLSDDTQQKVYEQWREDNQDDVEIDRSEVDHDYRQALKDDDRDIIEKANKAIEKDPPILPDPDPALSLGEGDQKFHLIRRVDLDTIILDDDGAVIRDELRTTTGERLSLTEAHLVEDAWHDHYSDAFEEAYEARYDDSDYNEKISELETEALNDRWDNYTSDRDKMDLMFRYGIEPEGGKLNKREPDTWVTGVETGSHTDEDYARTHAIALRLAEMRTDQIRAERGLNKGVRPTYAVRNMTPEELEEAHRYEGEHGQKYMVVDEYGNHVIGTKHFSSMPGAIKAGEEWASRMEGRPINTSNLIEDVWTAWKGSSSSGLSMAMQLAAARELGGHHRMTPEEVQEAEKDAVPYGGIATLQAYVRAQWEVTQTIMAKAKQDKVQVYRGLMLPGDEVVKARHLIMRPDGTAVEATNVTPSPASDNLYPYVEFDFNGEHFKVHKQLRDRPTSILDIKPREPQTQYESDAETVARGVEDHLNTHGFRPGGERRYAKLPDIQLKRSGAQSTTGTPDVANDWGGVGNTPPNPKRVVLRIDAPATSVLSLPVYGQNEQEEHETVLLGTPDRWGWDAWQFRAPTFKEVPMADHPAHKADTQPLLIDLQALDRGQPHWMSQTDWSKVQSSAADVLKWDESQHPREPKGSAHGGQFTEGVGHAAEAPELDTRAGSGGGSGPAAAPVSAHGGRPVASPDAQRLAQAYNARVGLPPIRHGYVSVNEGRAGHIADAYEALPVDDSANPEVRAAYEALSTEIQAQWDFLVEQGYEFIPATAETYPYKNSQDVINDIQNHKRLYFFTGGEPHPLLGTIDPQSGLSMNDKFRAVHDFFGHAAGGYGFGARGEENAWVSHSQMLTPLARRAMTTETRGQNSWVNYGRHNYDQDGNPKHIPVTQKPYAIQKAALFPDTYVFKGDRSARWRSMPRS